VAFARGGEERLTKSPSAIGGRRLLDAEIPPTPVAAADLLPVIPLNDLQLEAMQAVLGNHPLTVVSGPPGCGKSQVVVSVLLNAWARGASVLFASNPNQAVDVVRERLEKFEAEFPIAVRAGNREKITSSRCFAERSTGPQGHRPRIPLPTQPSDGGGATNSSAQGLDCSSIWSRLCRKELRKH
jgi:AAA domain